MVKLKLLTQALVFIAISLVMVSLCTTLSLPYGREAVAVVLCSITGVSLLAPMFIMNPSLFGKEEFSERIEIIVIFNMAFTPFICLIVGCMSLNSL